MSTNTVSVPLFDMKASLTPKLEADLKAAFARVLDSGSYVMGKEVQQFELEWAEYCGKKHCIGVGSGTEALLLALMAWKAQNNIGPYASVPVKTTPFTFWATTLSILQAGLHVDFMDVDPRTGNVAPQDFKGELALMVRMYGRPGNWTGYNLIEDMAHAHGQKILGRIGCFSFYPTKNLGCIGQGGAIVTDDSEIAELCYSMRDYGEKKRFHYEHLTGNHRLDAIQAAILRTKLPYLDVWNAERRVLAKAYIRGLHDVKGVFVPPDDPEHVYHIFGIRVKGRDSLKDYLDKWGIQSSVRYPVACHKQPAYPLKGYAYKHAESWADENLTLPLYPGMPLWMVDRVVEKIRDWVDLVPKEA
jgi:dTDP-4-amino-4,6-dideoxygalactose transaminase